MSKTATAVRYDEIDGKTVAGCGWGEDRMLIAFTDGTVLALTVDADFDGASIDFAQCRDIDLLSRQWLNESDEAGLITREEYQAAITEQEAAKAKRLEAELESLRQAAEMRKAAKAKGATP